MNVLQVFLQIHGASTYLAASAEKFSSIEEMVAGLESGELLEELAVLIGVPLRKLVLARAECAKLVIDLTENEDIKQTIILAEKFGREEEGVALDDLKEATKRMRELARQLIRNLESPLSKEYERWCNPWQGKYASLFGGEKDYREDYSKSIKDHVEILVSRVAWSAVETEVNKFGLKPRTSAAFFTRQTLFHFMNGVDLAMTGVIDFENNDVYKKENEKRIADIYREVLKEELIKRGNELFEQSNLSNDYPAQFSLSRLL
ncbi:MAG: hypothetical protein J5I50_08095 [Chitinophagaceae bacterium]|nr:hypothetical protein [Chitinophagaceae bacterium]